MKRIVLIGILFSGALSAQTVTVPPVRMAMYMTSDGGVTFNPLTSASGILPVTTPPLRFIPYCTSDGGATFSQCTIGGGGGATTPATNNLLQGGGSANSVRAADSTTNATLGTLQTLGQSGIAGAATGTSTPFSFTDSASNTGTGTLFNIKTATGSAASPFAVQAAGSAINSLYVNALGFMGSNTGTINTVTDPLNAIIYSSSRAGFQQSTTCLTPWTGTTGQNCIGILNSTSILSKGYNCGSSDTSCSSWQVGTGEVSAFDMAGSGIGQSHLDAFNKDSVGDAPVDAIYAYVNGGQVDSAGEGDLMHEDQMFQRVAWRGTCAAGCTTGSNLVTLTVTQGNRATEGGIAIDITKGGSITGTISAFGFDSTLNSTYYDVTGATFSVSPAYGKLNGSTCTPNSNGQFEVYSSTTCSITNVTGTFTTATPLACVSGPFDDTVTVTAFGSGTITFTSRRPWNSSNNATIMQGGLCGMAFGDTNAIATHVLYAAIGSTSATRVYFANCHLGTCNGNGVSSSILPVGSSIAFWPMAWVTGTNGGTSTQMQLGTNNVAFASSDSLLVGQQAQVAMLGMRLLMDRESPNQCTSLVSNCADTEGIIMNDVGAAPWDDMIHFTNGRDSTQPTKAGIFFQGAFQAGLLFSNLPTDSLLTISGNYLGGSTPSNFGILHYAPGTAGGAYSNLDLYPNFGGQTLLYFNQALGARQIVPNASYGNAGQFLTSGGSGGVSYWTTFSYTNPAASAVTATVGTGVTSVTCATATCTTERGTYTIVGGMATTGTIATLAWTSTGTAWACQTSMNGGTGFLGVGHSVATATGMNITAGVAVTGLTFTVDYSCKP